MSYFNKKGFTMLEVVMVLTIISVIATMLPLIIRTISPPKETSVNQQELSLFFQQIGGEIKGANSAKVENDVLYLFYPGDKVISYERKENKIIRKVNGDGYELVLQNISVFDSLLRVNQIAIYISDQRNFTYKRLYIMYIQKYQGETL